MYHEVLKLPAVWCKRCMFYWCWQFYCDSGPASLAVSSSVCSLDCRTAPETNPGGFSGSLFSGSLDATRLVTGGFVIAGSTTEAVFGKNRFPGKKSLKSLSRLIGCIGEGRKGTLREGLRGGMGSFSRGMTETELCKCEEAWEKGPKSVQRSKVLVTFEPWNNVLANNQHLKTRTLDLWPFRSLSHASLQTQFVDEAKWEVLWDYLLCWFCPSQSHTCSWSCSGWIWHSRCCGVFCIFRIPLCSKLGHKLT